MSQSLLQQQLAEVQEFTDPVHVQPFVLAEVNTVLLNMLCRNSH
jgi:hypothetical protein